MIAGRVEDVGLAAVSRSCLCVVQATARLDVSHVSVAS